MRVAFINYSSKLNRAQKMLFRRINTFESRLILNALSIGATLVSHNVGEFSRIEGLQLVDWAA